MLPSKKKILNDLDAWAAQEKRAYEALKAAAFDPKYAPSVREGYSYAARKALERWRDFESLAENLRAGLIDRSCDTFLEMYGA